MNIEKLLNNPVYWDKKAPNGATACLLLHGKVHDWIKWVDGVEYNFKHGTWIAPSMSWSLSEYLDYSTTGGYSFHQKLEPSVYEKELYKLNKKLERVRHKQLTLQRKEVALLHTILNYQPNK